APTNRSPSGGGWVFSNTQSAVIRAITPSTSWRLNASLKRRMTSNVALASESGMLVPPGLILPDRRPRAPCDTISAMSTPAPGPKDASPSTAALNHAVLDALPFTDTQDFDEARRGFLATLPEVEIKNDQGRVVWTLRDYSFLADEHAPATVNPSLWRLARLNLNHGLFQVTDRIYQIRGFDVSNMTLIEGDRGLVVVDPLMSTEVARAGLELYTQHRGRRPIVAVIYSHSHTDHYGGVRGVVDERDVSAGRVEVWAPDRFMQEVVSETVLAGTAMVRRAQFQFGPTLPKGPRGQ